MSVSQLPPALVALLNKCDEDYIVYAFMVPLRIIRVVVTTNFKTFRVEQFVRTNKDNLNPQGAWRTLSTHGSDGAGTMLGTAMQAAAKAQNDLRGKLQARTRARNKLVRS